MEAQIISREIIKPSSPTIQNRKPHKLTFLDQLTPTTYIPIILFYPMNDFESNTTTQTIITRLKKSLSETLNLYYPFSGRATDDNLNIDRFNEGVLFFEAKVNCSISNFLKLHEIESLNSFLPCKSFSKELDIQIPVIVIQVSVFTCGGIALGLCLSHKIMDSTTVSTFMTSWTSLYKGDLKGIINPDFDEPSLFFPARTSFPQNYLALMENLWFTEGNYIAGRFLFNAKAIATLKAKATKGKADEGYAQPTRIETLSAFIWKHCIEASKKISSSGSSKPSILVEAVNLRPKTNPPMYNGSIGNLFWWAIAIADPDNTNTELHELTSLLTEAIALFKTDYTHSLQGDDGFRTISENCDRLERLISEENLDIFAFTSWCHMPFTRPNFGWGEPCWVGLARKAGAKYRNATVFVDAEDGKGIEAWIFLDKKRMEILQNDPNFLAFASPNTRISIASEK